MASEAGTRHTALKDEVEALMWLSLAAAKGHAAAIENSNILRQRMTPEQIDAAAKRVVEWKPKAAR